jgi:hypothetical protein
VWREVIRVTREKESQPGGLVARLVEIQEMKTGALQEQISRLTGLPCRSFNKPFLQRKLSWLVQQAAAERQPSTAGDVAAGAPMISRPHSGPLKAPVQILPVRDPRLPRVGTVLLRDYRGLRLTVSVVEGGYLWNGAIFRSLSATARAITGQHMSGWAFFNLRQRKRSAK